MNLILLILLYIVVILAINSKLHLLVGSVLFAHILITSITFTGTSLYTKFKGKK